MGSRKLRYAVIGAGMSGLLAGIKLLERGERELVLFEKGHTVGGTWRENTYPGLACDTPAHSYTYSFAPNPDWSAYYAPGPEIQAYFEEMADRYGVRPYIRFQTPVKACTWNPRKMRWQIDTETGEREEADVVIAATGVLHHPHIPDIPGLADFRGRWWHSARWDHSVDLGDKRVGVIGSGSTGIQIVSALAGRVRHLVHFQRTPQWIMPCTNPPYTEEDKRLFRQDPSRIEYVRNGPEARARRERFLAAIADASSPQLAELQQIVERHLEESVRDPILREKLRPNYTVACKRLVFSWDYYEKIQQPGVTIEVAGIERVEGRGVRMRDGSFHPLDVLVLATGFHADAFVRPMRVIGRDATDLEELWAEHPTAYYAVTIPRMPNFFLLNGPTGPVGNFSLIEIAERQWNYLDQLMELLRSGKARAVEPTETALADYEARRTEAARRTVFATGCKSWYLDRNGVPQVWPWSYEHFLEVMARPRLADYRLLDG
ncbi:MAG: putative monooxygenase [Porticoccaceae bacterium]|nr:MAG: putative monooxygenase [Porticoccaceae bacterium]